MTKYFVIVGIVVDRISDEKPFVAIRFSDKKYLTLKIIMVFHFTVLATKSQFVTKGMLQGRNSHFVTKNLNKIWFL